MGFMKVGSKLVKILNTDVKDIAKGVQKSFSNHKRAAAFALALPLVAATAVGSSCGIGGDNSTKGWKYEGSVKEVTTDEAISGALVKFGDQEIVSNADGTLPWFQSSTGDHEVRLLSNNFYPHNPGIYFLDYHSTFLDNLKFKMIRKGTDLSLYDLLCRSHIGTTFVGAGKGVNQKFDSVRVGQQGDTDIFIDGKQYFCVLSRNWEHDAHSQLVRSIMLDTSITPNMSQVIRESATFTDEVFPSIEDKRGYTTFVYGGAPRMDEGEVLDYVLNPPESELDSLYDGFIRVYFDTAVPEKEFAINNVVKSSGGISKSLVCFNPNANRNTLIRGISNAFGIYPDYSATSFFNPNAGITYFTDRDLDMIKMHAYRPSGNHRSESSPDTNWKTTYIDSIPEYTTDERPAWAVE